METKQQAHIPAIREEQRQADLKKARAAYGSSSSYTPASDAYSAPFVPAAENYSPAPRES